MSVYDWLLVAITAFMFFGLGELGRRKPTLWLWRWADVIYYPLAAIGVVLLFFANDINRTLLRLEAEQAATEAAWRDRPNPQPNLDFAPRSAELLRARYSWFEVEIRWGDICKVNFEAGCLARQEHSEALRAAFGKFSVPSEGDVVAIARAEAQFCRAGFDYIERLARESVFGLGAYDRLSTALRMLGEGKDSAQLKAWLTQQMDEQQRNIVNSLNEQQRAVAESNIKIQTQHSVELLDQLAWCTNRHNSDDQNLRIFDAWKGEEANRSKTRAAYAQQLESARMTKTMTRWQRLSRSLQQQWWPYILVLALSIKFGKATSGISNDLDDIYNRGRIWFAGIMAWPRRLHRIKVDSTRSDIANASLADDP